MTTGIRGCPRCRRSVRAHLFRCPYCGELLKLTVLLTVLDETEELTVDAPQPVDD